MKGLPSFSPRPPVGHLGQFSGPFLARGGDADLMAFGAQVACSFQPRIGGTDNGNLHSNILFYQLIGRII
jgi:hypothetical protein